MDTVRKLIICLSLVVVSFVYAGASLGLEPDSSTVEPLLTLEVNNMPFNEVAGMILKQSGYKVIFDDKWSTFPVSGKYSDVTIDGFFRRVFRGQNTSLLFDSREKYVIVRFFGDKSFQELLSTALVDNSSYSKQIPQEISDLHRQQRQELEDYLKDPDSVDPMSGMKLVEIRGIHEEQHKQLELDKKNPATVDPVSGATLGEIENLHNAQRAEIDQFKNDPEGVEPDSGMTRAQIQQLHAAQQTELQRMLRDPNTIDPISGMKLSEIWEQAKKTGK